MPTPPKNKGGAPKGNTNGLTTGSKVRRLTVGELPPSMIAVKREGRAYRRELEAAVVAAKGEVSFTDSHAIDTAAAATIQAGVCRWLLRNKQVGEMSAAEIRACMSDITKAKERRDNAVRSLQIDTPPALNWIIEQ